MNEVAIINIAEYSGMEYETVKNWLDKYPSSIDDIAILKPDKLHLAGAIITDRTLPAWFEVVKT